MRRSEFWEEITRFYELRDFCNDEGIYVTDDYFDSDDWRGEVQSDFDNYDFDDWEDALNTLRGMAHENCDFYRREGYFDYTPCWDDDLDTLKERVVDIMDDRGAWDPEDDEEDDDYEYERNCDDDEYVYEDPPQPELNEGMSFDELSGFEVCELSQM